MARKTSDFLKAWGKGFEIFKALTDEVLSQGGSDADLERIQKDRKLRTRIAELLVTHPLDFLDRTVRIAIRGDRTLAQYLVDAAFDWVNPDIPMHWTLSVAVPDAEQEGLLLHYDQSKSCDEVLSDLERQSLRPATDRELLEFGISYPDVQRQFPVIALGNAGRVYGERRVLYLGRNGRRRALGLRWFDNDCDGSCRFLAFRK